MFHTVLALSCALRLLYLLGKQMLPIYSAVASACLASFLAASLLFYVFLCWFFIESSSNKLGQQTANALQAYTCPFIATEVVLLTITCVGPAWVTYTSNEAEAASSLEQAVYVSFIALGCMSLYLCVVACYSGWVHTFSQTESSNLHCQQMHTHTHTHTH